jgi:hypothetical protein
MHAAGAVSRWLAQANSDCIISSKVPGDNQQTGGKGVGQSLQPTLPHPRCTLFQTDCTYVQTSVYLLKFKGSAQAFTRFFAWAPAAGQTAVTDNFINGRIYP